MVRLILCRNINDCLWNAAISSLNRFTTSIKRQTEEEEEKKNKRTPNYVPEIQARPGLHASTIAIISILWVLIDLYLQYILCVLKFPCESILPSRHHVHTPHKLQYAFAFYFLCKTQLSISLQSPKNAQSKKQPKKKKSITIRREMEKRRKNIIYAAKYIYAKESLFYHSSGCDAHISEG